MSKSNVTMKASELIAVLSHVITEKGDLEMGLHDADVEALKSVGVKLPIKAQIPAKPKAPKVAPAPAPVAVMGMGIGRVDSLEELIALLARI